MYINILNVDKFIKEHDWKEVTVPNYFIPNTSENHPDGLISDEIFGKPGTEDRKKMWGYISLGYTIMSPQIGRAHV